MTKVNNERRSLLQGAALAGVAATVPATVGAAIKPVLDNIQRAEFPLPDFASILGQSVSLKTADGNVVATVTEVSELPTQSEAMPRPGYLRSVATVVRLTTDDASQFHNDLYRVHHPELGELELLLSPVPDANGQIGLEVIFN